MSSWSCGPSPRRVSRSRASWPGGCRGLIAFRTWFMVVGGSGNREHRVTCGTDESGADRERHRSMTPFGPSTHAGLPLWIQARVSSATAFLAQTSAAAAFPCSGGPVTFLGVPHGVGDRDAPRTAGRPAG
jgi:hypothetical protein